MCVGCPLQTEMSPLPLPGATLGGSTKWCACDTEIVRLLSVPRASWEGGSPSPYHKPHLLPRSHQLTEADTDSRRDWKNRGEKQKDQQKLHVILSKTSARVYPLMMGQYHCRHQ